MLESIKKLKQMNVKDPEINVNIMPLNKNVFFNFQKTRVKKTKENSEFIEILKEQCHTDMKINGTFGCYYFDLKGAYLEIFISIEDDEIEVDPYLIYKEGVRENVQKIIYREFFLYCLFKRHSLQ